ncbi:HPr family phosphocarrier protein [Marinobacterium sediminicola]|uniref:Phosphocarrier protein n=1 Tax=Marinobacterium sediminicola TaxID=518898 RepID=A0ABY1RYD7_9GAMM|nr:HPr family phosphocarrier protein [Marinobacterium sediminicola]ULG68681.1 HPr family phosphocarrier protein [Marinobacterium sediminicola]SMR73204.1 phosphocarrier protein [Marinobacterium sediminicola]
MIEKRLTIINKLGLHARAAAKLVTTASQFQSDIRITRDTREIDGKSIMSVMMLAASKGTELQLSAHGEDEEAALEALELLINNRFDEPE